MNLIIKKNALKRRIGETQNGFKKLEEAQGILENKRQKLKWLVDKFMFERTANIILTKSI